MNSHCKVAVQKRCRCRKTKCLKLYCDCFKAGLYCGETCSCQGCFNRTEYEDTVAHRREVIQLRDPLAFSPNISCLTQSAITHNEDENQPTVIVGKHRKGCNCRKSMCVKKYCECYQANVGCGTECRCEGCENLFGKKGKLEYVCNKAHNTVKKERESTDSEFCVPEFCTPQNVTPMAPFQHLGYGNDVMSTGRYIPAQESGNCEMMFETNAQNFGMVHLDQRLYPNVEYMNQFTPMMASLPPLMNWPNSARASGNYSSVGSVYWNGSPVTPVTLFGDS